LARETKKGKEKKETALMENETKKNGKTEKRKNGNDGKIQNFVRMKKKRNGLKKPVELEGN